MSVMTSIPRLRRLATAALAIFLCVPATGLRAQAPSLAELARKEQERRKTVKAAGKVYSNKDLPKPVETATPGTAALPPATEQKPAEAKPEQKPDQKDDKGNKDEKDEKDETWWRARITQAREAQRRAEVFAEALQSRINALSADAVNRDDPYQRAKAAQDRQKAVNELARVTSEIDQAKKEIAAIEEEARQGGVPPGWLR